MNDLDPVVQSHVARMLEASGEAPPAIDPDLGLQEEYGMTSMMMVLLLTDLCEATDVALASFTDHQLAALKTARDVSNALATARKVN